MRWDVKVVRGPQEGDTRTVCRFLWWPTVLVSHETGRLEGRWLEWAWVVQEFAGVNFLDGGGVVYGWKHAAFAAPGVTAAGAPQAFRPHA